MIHSIILFISIYFLVMGCLLWVLERLNRAKEKKTYAYKLFDAWDKEQRFGKYEKERD